MRGILLDDNGDLIVRGGTLLIGDNATQCVQHILIAFTGEYKHAPLLGGNIKKMINGTPDPFWSANVRRQLKSQRIEVKRITIADNGNIEIEINE